MDEHERQAQAPDDIPVLQIRNIDFSYGDVQVLFNVELEVHRGEILALLGTNGAGKSSILRVVAGLATPSRGVVRLNGKTITYVSPEQRVTLGIDFLPGGKAVFPTMTVADNLEMGAYAYRKDKADRDRRIARVLDLFPTLNEKLTSRADASLEGSSRCSDSPVPFSTIQRSSSSMSFRWAFAPLVVQVLLVDPRTASAVTGMTIVIVEQSLDVALSIVDRAVFLEKGQVRFEGRPKICAGS